MFEFWNIYKYLIIKKICCIDILVLGIVYKLFVFLLSMMIIIYSYFFLFIDLISYNIIFVFLVFVMGVDLLDELLGFYGDMILIFWKILFIKIYVYKY